MSASADQRGAVEVPLAADGLLPPPGLVRALARSAHAATARLTLLPPHNAWLPDALADAGVAALAIPGLASARWRGCGGGEVLLNGGGEAATGELVRPWIPPPPGPDVVSSARRHAAEAVWALGLGPAEPLAIASLGAANPFPAARAALVRLRVDGVPPPALRTGDGALHPAQAVGEHELLCRLELDGLGATALAPHPGAVAGARWEVGATVLDNGRVRAELDARGSLTRLSGDGTYAACAGPALALAHAGSDCGPGRVLVREQGPVRATIAVVRDAGDIELSALAHEPVLAVRIRPRADGLTLTLPIDAAVALAGDGVHAVPWERGRAMLVRWAFLGDGRGGGLAITCDRAASAVRDAHGVRISIRCELGLRLHPAARLDAPGPWWDAAGDHAPHLALGPADAPRPPRWRLWCPPGVVAGWCGREADAVELVLHELLGGRTRPALHLGSALARACAVTAAPLAGQARALEREDGAIALGPHGSAVVRFAPRA